MNVHSQDEEKPVNMNVSSSQKKKKKKKKKKKNNNNNNNDNNDNKETGLDHKHVGSDSDEGKSP